MWYVLPGVKPIGQWFPPNKGFYVNFNKWLKEAGYSTHSMYLYGISARTALGLLDRPYWLIDPEADIQQVRDYLVKQVTNEATRATYFKGLLKLQQYLLFRCHRPAPERVVNWPHYIGTLSPEVAQNVRDYVTHRRRAWPPTLQYRNTIGLLSRLTLPLRWLSANATLKLIADLTPALWFDYLDTRLEEEINPRTLNSQLQVLQSFLQFLAEMDRPICERMLKVDTLTEGTRLPRGVPLEQLNKLLAEIETDANSVHAGLRRLGVMDKAWYFLMLHSGLRSVEVRRLQMVDLDLEHRRVRIEQSKGLKDRIVCLSGTAIEGIRAYLAVRGPTVGDHVFIFRHLPLTSSYFGQRLETYAERCGVRITPHQLRHSCATLLLNAGAPILTVQTILGHKHIDTTLGYARLYDGTVAADYYRAMAGIENGQTRGKALVNADAGQLLALVDSLQNGTLNEAQRETVSALRGAILTLANM